VLRNPQDKGGRAGAPRPGKQPFDLEQFLEQGRTRFNRRLPREFSRGNALAVVCVIFALWLLSGIYIVGPEEQGVILRFGAVKATAAPGINYHLPWPIESALTPKVTRENQIDIGYRLVGGRAARQVPEESLSLTGDENIVDIDFTAYWRIKEAPAFLFNVENLGIGQDLTIRTVAESAMREVVGKNSIDSILTVDRAAIQDEVQTLMQSSLDTYRSGVVVTRVQMQKADPPAQVLAAYRDVQAARTDQDRMRNEAEAYANKVVPEARGGAARLVQEAEAYKQQAIDLAEGESQRFTSIFAQYKNAPEVTRERIYLETMQGILAGVNKVIVDNKSRPNVTPYLPLPQLQRGAPVPERRGVPATPPPVADGRGPR
jgi:membrane protease subunit HflK